VPPFHCRKFLIVTFLNIAEAAYHGPTSAKSKEFEQIIWSKVVTSKSSALLEYPWGQLRILLAT
jgi:hypothetical protein